MELGSIVGYLENRSILVTGATGFLAKIFIEKILRAQPNVKKLYLLLRAADDKAAMLRFNTEAVGKDLFRVVREMHKEKLGSFLSERVRVVAGDVTCHDLGVEDSILLHDMWKQLDVVVNIAATTNFDERYDTALRLNTLGAKHVLDFSKKCVKKVILLHTSTAYVSGEKQGLILETPYKMGDTLNGTSGLDINEENKLMEHTLEQLAAQNSSQDTIKSAMKELGMQRSRKYGWPNTYVFTKAMGEMLLGELKENIPLIIIRPTIVTSTFKEPFPGWVEGIRTIDSLAMGYAKGQLKCFVGNPKSTIDVIPADMVVNAMIVAIAAHDNQPSDQTIYHVGSSVSSPLEFTRIQDSAFQHFTEHPWINKDGKPVTVGKVKVLDTMDSFQRYLNVHFLLPLKGLQLVNTLCCQYFQTSYLEQSRKIKFVMKMIDLYTPYLFFKGYYDDMNTEKLRRAAKESGADKSDVFCFDPKRINWEDYFKNTHFPGLVKSVSRWKRT